MSMDRSLSQLDPIERNILRMSLFELMNNKINDVIVINEAIRLSKKFGSSEGYKFVNAILDKLIKGGLKRN